MTQHRLLNVLGDYRGQALKQASQIQIIRELYNEREISGDYTQIQRTAEVLELIVLDLIIEERKSKDSNINERRSCARDAFRLYRVLPRPKDPITSAKFLLRASSLAVLGEMGADAARLLSENEWPALPFESEDWRERTWATVLDIWLRLIRKQGWDDRDKVLERIKSLRESQEQFEIGYLGNQVSSHAKVSALELIGLYHLAKAAEVFAVYITDGVVEGKYQIHQLLDVHFDRVLSVCNTTQLVELEPLTRLLAATSYQMADNCIWTVTRSVNSRVTKFVKTLVDRGRGKKAIFDMLPPQRRALAEEGLLGSSRRAVVVSLPTSSGKTLIAEFRILQALNQFDRERGWVAYLAPTRTLVNQIARKLRHDFKPLDILVEQVSPALEIDSIEVEILQQQDQSQEFRVLVTTPEKLDLMLRQGWEAKIGRPLTLVVVDEAHNIQDVHRGLKLELLLSTINNECQQAQFLLLTPFIRNAQEVARWLGGQNSQDISVSLDWQPNDRVIGIVQAKKGVANNHHSYDYDLRMVTIRTTKQTLVVDDLLVLPKNENIASTFNKVINPSTLAAVTAQYLQKRGPVIVMHTRPDWVWSLAEQLKIEENRIQAPSENIRLVQDFLKLEFGTDFPLISLLSYGIGVHHAGLSDDVRTLMEWLFEENELKILVATTTIAQGVNFPVSGVVMASHQYPYGVDMPPEDFWNIAGRAGRVDQGSLGVVALVAENASKEEILREFIDNQENELNSALIILAKEADRMMREDLCDFGNVVYQMPEWSAFLQYLAHSYYQMGEPEEFSETVEQVLRGTFGFDRLRRQDSALANRLLDGVNTYTQYLQKPGQPIKLVDSTGFSLNSIRTVLNAASREGIRASAWNSTSLFSSTNRDLEGMMGVLLKVPELRENLNAVTGGRYPDGQKLAKIIKDWVNGATIPDISRKYFMNEGDNDLTKGMTDCGKNLYGKLTQTASWGLGALLSITGGDLPEEQFKLLRNLPSRVYYGVNDDTAIALRLLGVPRTAAIPLARSMSNVLNQPLNNVRNELRSMDESMWQRALGTREGKIYRKVWRVLEGFE